ncbi:MAG: hypothetical protein K9K37_10330 [Desulfocapsa sp.]|nr:hypothetical protein [Desulfocapsa sp.]
MISIRPFQRMVAILFILTIPVQALAGREQRSDNVHVDIVADQRGILHRFDAGSQWDDTDRSYIIARQDERYRIRVSNTSNKRIGVVIAVDGRNIISGKKSYLKSNERMYILGPHQSQEYEGWRTGRNQINRFYFTGMEDSYAAHWGDQTAMGVVAVAVFHERHQQVRRQQNGGNNPVAKGGNRRLGQFNAQKEHPGTGFGEGDWSPSREVHFVAQNKPFRKTFIKYEWRRTLCRLGLVQCSPNHTYRGPDHNRFWPDNRPQNRRNESFAPFPSWFSAPGF